MQCLANSRDLWERAGKNMRGRTFDRRRMSATRWKMKRFLPKTLSPMAPAAVTGIGGLPAWDPQAGAHRSG